MILRNYVSLWLRAWTVQIRWRCWNSWLWEWTGQPIRSESRCNWNHTPPHLYFLREIEHTDIIFRNSCSICSRTDMNRAIERSFKFHWRLSRSCIIGHGGGIAYLLMYRSAGLFVLTANALHPVRREVNTETVWEVKCSGLVFRFRALLKANAAGDTHHLEGCSSQKCAKGVVYGKIRQE